MTQLAYKFIDNLLVMAQGSGSPSDDEVTAMVEDLKGRDIDALRAIALSQGGGPSMAQRKRLTEIIGGRSMRFAIVSDAVKTRIIGTALGLFSAGVRSFPLAEIDKALEHLELPKERWEMVRGEMQGLLDQIERR